MKIRNPDYPEHLFKKRRCRDYACPSNADLRGYFTHQTYRLHEKSFKVYALAEMVLRRLGHSDIVDNSLGNIPFSHLEKFKVETTMFLAKRLALYILHPQRYGHHPSNIISSSLMFFTERIWRFRGGWKLPKKHRYQIKKSEVGILVEELCDNSYLWDLAEKYVDSYKWRLAHGYCEEI